MLANFTEETCTGTGTTLALAGATSGMIPFAQAFSDGDVVAYVVEDSGGVIKVAGVGLYNSGADSITRTDEWSYDTADTPDITENRTTNKTLSGGTHTVRCAVTDNLLHGLSGYSIQGQANIQDGALQSAAGDNYSALPAANTQISKAFFLRESANINTLEIQVGTAGAGGALASLGISKLIDGFSHTAYIANATIDITTTGAKSITINKVLSAGWYMCHIVADDATVTFSATNTPANRSIPWTPLKSIQYANRDAPSGYLKKASVTSGVLDTSPETVTTEQSGNDLVFNFHLTRN